MLVENVPVLFDVKIENWRSIDKLQLQIYPEHKENFDDDRQKLADQENLF